MKSKIAIVLLLGLLGAAAPPLLQAQVTETYTYTTNRLVPDGNPAGLQDARSVSSAIGTIGAVKVKLKLAGEFNGDLYGYLRHVQNGVTNFCVLLDRPGRASTNSAGYADSGLDVTFQHGAANGDIHFYRNVTTPAAGAPLTGIWQPDGRTADPTNVTELSLRSTTLSSFSGGSAAGEWTLYLADLESGGTNMLREWALEISGGAYPTLTWATPAGITYGTALSGSQLNATATFDSTNVPGTFTYSYPAGTVLNAGANQTINVTFTPADSATFLAVSTNVSINVTPAPLTITAQDKSKLYGAAVPTLTASYSGFVNGDTFASLDTPVTLATTATAASNVGTYAITATGAADANYSIAYVNGTLTVTPAALTITADDKSKLYGAALPTLTASYSGFVNGDTFASLDTPVTLATTATAASTVGTYAITASGAADLNYAITYASGTLSVTPVTITVTADDKSKVYGASLPTLTAAYAGFVLGQGPGNLTTLATLSTTATASSDVGAYPITASGATSPNYTFAYVAGTLTIGQASTTGAIATSANPAAQGASVTFTMTVSPVAPGAGTPNGSVNFRIDGTVAGSGALSGGVASFSTSSLTHGSHTVVAEYAGGLNFIGITNTLTPNQAINSAPIAGGDTIERYATQGVKVLLTTLLSNDSDADNDPLSITVSSSSANGGTITVSGGWVFYTPAPGYTGVDSFTYTITDGYGGSTVGTVAVNIKVDDDPGQNLTITPLGGEPQSYRITGSGIPGRTYRLQYTDTPTPTNWQNLPGASVTADSNGVFTFTDTSGSPTRFYRSVFP